jgi:hypothetical protein
MSASVGTGEKTVVAHLSIIVTVNASSKVTSVLVRAFVSFAL